MKSKHKCESKVTIIVCLLLSSHAVSRIRACGHVLARCQVRVAGSQNENLTDPAKTRH